MRVIQTAQAGRGQDQRIIVARVELAQPRVEIPANGLETGAGKQTRELRDAPDAAGPDAGRGSEEWPGPPAASRRRRPPGSTTASRGSSRGSTAPMRQPVGQNGRQVLAAVHGEVDLAGQQAVFDFLHEEPLAADLRQGGFGEPSPDVLMTTISQSMPACVLSRARGGVRLKQRELTAARPELQVVIEDYFRRSAGVESAAASVELDADSPVRRRNSRLTASV